MMLKRLTNTAASVIAKLLPHVGLNSPTTDADMPKDTHRRKLDLILNEVIAGSDGSVASRTSRIEAAGRADGARGAPASQATQLGLAEHVIVERGIKAAAEVDHVTQQEMSLLLDRVRKQRIDPVDVEFAKAKIQAEATVARTNREPDLLAKHAALSRKLAQLRSFQSDNELTRDAVYAPVQMLVWFQFGLYLSVDAVANMFLFATAVPTGFLGGLLVALGSSGVNVGLGLFTGMSADRAAIHIDDERSAKGRAWGRCGMVAALIWNGLVAIVRHFLALSAQTPEESGLLAQAVGALISGVLFAIGIGIFLVSRVKARGGPSALTDEYIDYRKYDLLAREAQDEFDEMWEAFSAAAFNAAEGVHANIVARHRTDEVGLQDMRDAVAAMEGLQLDAVAAVTHLNIVMRGQLKTYRAPNIHVRGTRPPETFGIEPQLAALPDPYPALTRARTLLKEAETQNKANASVLAELDLWVAGWREKEAKSVLEYIEAAPYREMEITVVSPKPEIGSFAYRPQRVEMQS